MSFPVITASSSTTVPQMVYGAWWLSQFAIDARDPTNVKAVIVLHKYGADADGNVVLSPVDPSVSLTVDDVLRMADPLSPNFDLNVATVVSVLLTHVQQFMQTKHPELL